MTFKKTRMLVAYASISRMDAGASFDNKLLVNVSSMKII